MIPSHIIVFCIVTWRISNVLDRRCLLYIRRYIIEIFRLQILCRQPHLDEGIYNELVEKAKEEGYDVNKLQKTVHTDPPPESQAAPDDTKGVWWFKSLLGK